MRLCLRERARAVKGEASGGLVSDVLQRKLKDLEEENLSLRSEASHLKSETETYEEKEQQLVNDCVKELREPPVVLKNGPLDCTGIVRLSFLIPQGCPASKSRP